MADSRGAKTFGERRSYVVCGSFNVPWETSNERIDFAKYMREFLETVVARDSEYGNDVKFEKLLAVIQSPEPVLDPAKGIVKDFTFRAVFSKRLHTLTLELSDAQIAQLIERYPKRFNERMVS